MSSLPKRKKNWRRQPAFNNSVVPTYTENQISADILRRRIADQQRNGWFVDQLRGLKYWESVVFCQSIMDSMIMAGSSSEFSR